MHYAIWCPQSKPPGALRCYVTTSSSFGARFAFFVPFSQSHCLLIDASDDVIMASEFCKHDSCSRRLGLLLAVFRFSAEIPYNYVTTRVHGSSIRNFTINPDSIIISVYNPIIEPKMTQYSAPISSLRASQLNVCYKYKPTKYTTRLLQ